MISFVGVVVMLLIVVRVSLKESPFAQLLEDLLLPFEMLIASPSEVEIVGDYHGPNKEWSHGGAL